MTTADLPENIRWTPGMDVERCSGTEGPDRCVNAATVRTRFTPPIPVVIEDDFCPEHATSMVGEWGGWYDAILPEREANVDCSHESVSGYMSGGSAFGTCHDCGRALTIDLDVHIEAGDPSGSYARPVWVLA